MSGNDPARGPILSSAGSMGPRLDRLYAAAVRNLMSVNTVDELRGVAVPRFFRAGRGYPEPWTRDAAVNCWFAGSLLDPATARQTLTIVTERNGDKAMIAQDEQWWDQILWVHAAWFHFCATGDHQFLTFAYEVGQRSLAVLRSERFNSAAGLYAGPGFMQDGISGLPTPPNDPTIASSFVLDYPEARDVMTLSTNAAYRLALRALQRMAEALGEDGSAYGEESAQLAYAIRSQLWLESRGRFGYLRHGSGKGRGTIDESEEAAGLALSVLADLMGSAESIRMLNGIHREPSGVVNVWPHFADRYGAERPGRHNVLCWPVVFGLVNLASAHAGAHTQLRLGLEDILRLVEGSGDAFFETYHPVTGAPAGGWQSGKTWRSEPDQTWSATALIASVHHGLLGLRPTGLGVQMWPYLPPGLESIALEGMTIRGQQVAICVVGSRARVPDRFAGSPVLAPGASFTGVPNLEQSVVIRVRDRDRPAAF